jgi:glutamate racemase
MWSKIRQFTPASIRLLSQGPIVAQSLADYLIRHPEKEQRCSKGGSRTFLTTEADPNASEKGSLFYGQPLFMQQIELN